VVHAQFPSGFWRNDTVGRWATLVVDVVDVATHNFGTSGPDVRLAQGLSQVGARSVLVLVSNQLSSKPRTKAAPVPQRVNQAVLPINVQGRREAAETGNGT
jgi:hypothetical protein